MLRLMQMEWYLGHGSLALEQVPDINACGFIVVVHGCLVMTGYLESLLISLA